MGRITLLAILLLISQIGVAAAVPQAPTGQVSSKTGDSISREIYAGEAAGGDTGEDMIAGDLGNRTIPFTLELKGHTSIEDIEQCGRILRKEGQDGLFRTITTALVTLSKDGPTIIGVQESANNADSLKEVRLKSNGAI